MTNGKSQLFFHYHIFDIFSDFVQVFFSFSAYSLLAVCAIVWWKYVSSELLRWMLGLLAWVPIASCFRFDTMDRLWWVNYGKGSIRNIPINGWNYSCSWYTLFSIYTTLSSVGQQITKAHHLTLIRNKLFFIIDCCFSSEFRLNLGNFGHLLFVLEIILNDCREKCYL